LTFRELGAKGAIRLNRDTLGRQGRRVQGRDDKYWQKYLSEAEKNETNPEYNHWNLLPREQARKRELLK
jgi:hypothetical protein